jgi:hypothetical protein
MMTSGLTDRDVLESYRGFKTMECRERLQGAHKVKQVHSAVNWENEA